MAEISYIQVTRDCNLNCIICSNPPTGCRLEFDQAKKEVEALVKRKCDGVILTGGEPTLYPQLPDLIRYCLAQGVFPRIITNGQKIADMEYLKLLKDAGLRHLHLSVYSCRPEIQEKITKHKGSFDNLERSLNNLNVLGDITVNVNTVINAYNADHLSKTVRWLLEHYPFINHFVFNNLDPLMNRAAENPDVIPRLNDFELELHEALSLLQRNGKTFRVESVPLCYLTDFEDASTETRKIVKQENRTTYFLDQRGEFSQDHWYYKKGACCSICSLNTICAGLYAMGQGFEEKELYPVFIDPENIIKKIQGEL